MKIFLIAILTILCLAAPAFAMSTQESTTMTHNVEMELDGQWDYSSTAATDGDTGYSVTIEGEGYAFYKSEFSVTKTFSQTPNWWDVF